MTRHALRFRGTSRTARHRRTTRSGRGAWPGLVGVSVAALIASSLASVPAIADDGEMVRKNVSDTPTLFTEQAQLGMISKYYPATARSGAPATTTAPDKTELPGIVYYGDADGNNQGDYEIYPARDMARPLIATYFDEVLEDDTGDQDGSGDGAGSVTGQSGVDLNLHRDAFAAVSLDDGQTWRQENLSESAWETSFKTLEGYDFPGDVMRVVQSVAGDRVLVAWTSKYCDQGSPRFAEKVTTGEDLDGDGKLDEVDADGDGKADSLYDDPFGVGGSQRSIDYAELDDHGEAIWAEEGEVPFSCVWTARGTMEQYQDRDGNGDLDWEVLWRTPERLTSGVRDADVPAIDSVNGVGFALVWQEDPEGLRPGSGEGPGEGWSGATVNHKTDMWYSHIGWDDFEDVVDNKSGEPITDLTTLTSNRPKVATQMSMPVRMTDNDICLSDDSNPYCTGVVYPGTKGEGGGQVEIVAGTVSNDVTEATAGDGVAQNEFNLDDDPEPEFVADTDGDGPDLCATTVQVTNKQGALKDVCVTDDGRLLNGQIGASRTRMSMEPYFNADGTVKGAWVVLAYEETKGLGSGHVIDPATGQKVPPVDDGKDVMYHSFDMTLPGMVAAGYMLNMPTLTPTTQYDGNGGGTPAGVLPELILNDAGQEQFQTDIARRAAVMTQPGLKIKNAVDRTGMTSGVILYKEGSQNQGGPADIFIRRFLVPADFDPTTDNPYDVKNAECTGDVRTDLPAYPTTAYPNGVCVTDGSINVSGTIPMTSEPLDNASDGELPTHGITDRITSFDQTEANLDEYHWANKWDVSKGHRGFLDGDFLALMYAYSPNWLATSKGHEPYNLYMRRSFDGGKTWTTTPAGSRDMDRDGDAEELNGDGTTVDQVFGVGTDAVRVTYTYGPEQFERARNVSMLDGGSETVLDPRYTQTSPTYESILTNGSALYPDTDVRDPSKFFVVFETGQTDPVEEGLEADADDLFYSRATAWGDDYDNVDWYDETDGVWEKRWDWLENKKDDKSGEAAVQASPAGDLLYAIWNQWVHGEPTEGMVEDSDAIFRRLLWDDTNTDPVADAGGTYDEAVDLFTYTAAADERVTLSAAGSTDPDGDDLTYMWDLDGDGIFETDGAEVTLVATGSTQLPAVKVTDGKGGSDVAQGYVNATKGSPRVWNLKAANSPAPVGTPVAVAAKFNDPGVDDGLHTAVVSWGDGTASAPMQIGEEALDGKGSALVEASHAYAKQGLYTVKVEVTDSDDNTGFDVLRHVVVYDQKAGTVDGKDVTFTDPITTGIASLKFNARYDKGATAPTGKMTFAFGDIAFAVTQMDYLVIDGAKVFAQGTGQLADGRSQHFLVSAVDAKPDKVRVKIWQSNGRNQHVVYDSQPREFDDAEARTPILKGGAITIERR